jgi:hypothetical protein
MIYEGSRYDGERVVQVKDHLGRMQPAIYIRLDVDSQFFQFDVYVTKEGDRLDNIAFDAYDDPEMWWIIARANPEVFYSDDIPYGTVLRIPWSYG